MTIVRFAKRGATFEGGLRVLDPRHHAVLIRLPSGDLEDQTSQLLSYEPMPNGTVKLTYGSGTPYPYNANRVQILSEPTVLPVAPGTVIEVEGSPWINVVELRQFTGPEHTWVRVFSPDAGSCGYRTVPSDRVRILGDVAPQSSAAETLSYWSKIVDRLDLDSPLRKAFTAHHPHPDSALAHILAGRVIERQAWNRPLIFPFRCNLSQRVALNNALGHKVSIIEGPPGTGKTETILNLITNVVAFGAGSIGVVSSTNAAVDNVRDKLATVGFGPLVANLGKTEKRQAFLADQGRRNSALRELVARAPAPPPLAELAEIDQRLARLQTAERQRAERREQLNAFRLERWHFEQHLARHQIPDLDGFPLLQRSSSRILDFLVDTEVNAGKRRGLRTTLMRYLKYGSMRGLDPDDTDVILRAQHGFYKNRVAELESQLAAIEQELARADFDQLAEHHRRQSLDTLHASLTTRYENLPPTIYSWGYRYEKTFARFSRDYPVLLSTCHSLAKNIPPDHLIDFLIIDEASQVDVITASLALSRCRTAVIVGDLQQLPPVTELDTSDLHSPNPAFDYEHHSILSAVHTQYGNRVPRQLLREHYRCDPAIIGFCNKRYYKGQLIPFTQSSEKDPMIVWRTVAGNHMRQHRQGGRSNQREIDVIEREVIPTHCAGVAAEDIGITTPYRLQANKVSDRLSRSLIDPLEADTVHKFQGRQKDVIILTTVLDDSWRGRTGLPFVDDPRLVNVAVSRAAKRFILVTHESLLPESRHLRDLIGYIHYHSRNQGPIESGIVSVFDLLYREYSERLRPLAARLRNEVRYKSEDIIWTVLADVLTDERYAHLNAVHQVLLRHLVPDLNLLTTAQAKYVRHRASVDFVVYNQTSNRPALAIEVDGFAFHENNPDQLRRDELKNTILAELGLKLLRLATTGSDEPEQLRHAIEQALESAESYGSDGSNQQ